MRPVTRLSAIFALAFCCEAVGQFDAKAHSAENAGIGVEQVGVLVYPPSMTYNAIYSGEVRAVISISETGALADYLVVGYTHRDFADAAEAAIRRWIYHPALVDGTPRASRAELVFEFRDRGVIVQTFPGALVRRAFFSQMDEHFAYRPTRLGELDRIPVPVQVVAPAVKSAPVSHSVTVEFFIDESGKVRMPAVDREYADDPCAAAAINAVEQWRFEPPTRKGSPVLVSASQEFHFQQR